MKEGLNESLFSYPDETGHFGRFGGKFVSETLMAALSVVSLNMRFIRFITLFCACAEPPRHSSSTKL